MSNDVDKWNDQVNPEHTEIQKQNKETLVRHPNVNLYLSTIDALINEPSYDFGRFMTRLLRRFNLVDDFWMPGIACCQYNPSIRRISIKINPLTMWDYLLRHVAIKDLSAKEVNAIDSEMLDAFKDGGWQQNRFKTWIDFLTSDKTKVNFRTCFLAVIIHEVLHCAWNHLSVSRNKKDHKLANIAQDFAINQTLDFTIFNRMFMTTQNKDLLFAFFEGGAPLQEDENIKNKYDVLTQHMNKIKEKFDNLLTAGKTDDEDERSTDFFKEAIKTISIEDFDQQKFLNQPFEYYYSLLLKSRESLQSILKKSKLKSGMGGKCPACGGSGKKNGGQGQGQGCKNDEPCPVCNGDGDMYDFFQHVLGQENDDESDEDWNNLSDEEKAEKIAKACGRNGQSNSGISQFDGFNPTTSEMKKVLKNDVKRTVDDMISRGEIRDPSELARERPFNFNAAFIKAIEDLYKTNTKPWDRLLKNQIMKCLGMKTHDYTMKREARGAPGMFPGKSRLKSFDLIIVMDVSGSINHEDYNRFVNEIEKIAKQVDHPHVRYIQFHSQVSLDITVPLKKVRTVGIPETGGTVLSVPLDMLRNERNKKLVVIFTDGWVESDIKNDYVFPSIMFVSASGNSEVCEDLSNRGWRVIHQDGDNDWWS